MTFNEVIIGRKKRRGQLAGILIPASFFDKLTGICPRQYFVKNPRQFFEQNSRG